MGGMYLSGVKELPRSLSSTEERVQSLLGEKIGTAPGGSYSLQEETLVYMHGKESKLNLNSTDDRPLLALVSDRKLSSTIMKGFKGKADAPLGLDIYHLQHPSGQAIAHAVIRKWWESPPVKAGGRLIWVMTGRVCEVMMFTTESPTFDPLGNVQENAGFRTECSVLTYPFPWPVNIETKSLSSRGEAATLRSSVSTAKRAGAYHFDVVDGANSKVASVKNVSGKWSILARYTVEVDKGTNPISPLLHVMATLAMYAPVRASSEELHGLR